MSLHLGGKAWHNMMGSGGGRSDQRSHLGPPLHHCVPATDRASYDGLARSCAGGTVCLRWWVLDQWMCEGHDLQTGSAG